MRFENPELTVEILVSAEDPTPHPELERVLAEFAAYFRRIGRGRHLGPEQDVEDAVQEALVAITSRRKLHQLQNPRALGSWARSILVHELVDAAAKAHPGREVRLGGPEDDPDELLANLAPVTETPEDLARAAERLEVLREFLERNELARLRWLDDLPEKAIVERTGLSRDQVAGRLKRLRRRLKRLPEPHQ